MRSYFNAEQSNPFAASLFDTVGENMPDSFGVADLLALNLLDERLGPPAIRAILMGAADPYLRAVRANVDLWEATDGDRSSANDLRSFLLTLPGVGPTKAAKLCARKRPRLIPIYDSVVGRVLLIGREPWWRALAEALGDSSRRDHFLDLVRGLDCAPTVLRIVDVAIWTVGSNAQPARDARARVGMNEDPLF